MKLKANDMEAANVDHVLLDGKRVPMVYEVDEEAGSVTSWSPVLPDDLQEGRVVEREDTEEVGVAGMELVKRQGLVRIIWRQGYFPNI